jgi:hypothetical protein
MISRVHSISSVPKVSSVLSIVDYYMGSILILLGGEGAGWVPIFLSFIAHILRNTFKIPSNIVEPND